MSLKFDKFIEMIRYLRGPKGCPWDQVQTFKSLSLLIIEEAYELSEAMQKEDYPNLKEEVGDVLLHVVFIVIMAEEKNVFNIENVKDTISEKMIRRHPHVFAEDKINTPEGVEKNWDKIKNYKF